LHSSYRQSYSELIIECSWRHHSQKDGKANAQDRSLTFSQKQEGFPSHEFVEVDLAETHATRWPEEIDRNVVRFITHESRELSKGNMIDLDPRGKWNRGKKHEENP
jgi:hypothetical protein